MATGAPLTLIDLARRTDPDGDAADVAEILSQANEIYDDLVWKEGNTNTGHVYTVRTSIPQGWWRYIGQGVPMMKSTTAQGRVNCGMLEGNSTIDLKLLEMSGDENKFRYEEDNAFMEGLGQNIAGTFVYGNNPANPAQFTGFCAFYSAISGAVYNPNMFDGGGTGSNNGSINLIGWNPRTIYGMFPKHSKAGLTLEPLDYVQVAYDAAGNPYRAKMTWFKQEAGLVIEDWRWGARYCNLDVTSAGLGGTSPSDLFATMSKMVLRMPKLARSNSGITETDAKSEGGLVVRPAFYTNRTIRGFMDIQAIRDKNVLISHKDYAGAPVTSFREIPIRVNDQQTITETRVT